MEQRDVVIIGGGPAGLAAAVALHEMGVRDLVVLEREKATGGILRQCIHDGFGLARFGESMSGPEYAQRFIDRAERYGVDCRTDASVIDVSPDRMVTAVSPRGLIKIGARAVVLATGCRERTRGALGIPGERPAGVMTAGVAQAYINLYNRMVGREVVIVGSGDIGMIMARRLTLEGARVRAVFEIQPVPSGLRRNIEQCLNDYGIPLYLSRTVTAIHGGERVTGVTTTAVDERLRPVPGTEEEYACDTVILSVGLIPENELALGAGVQLDGRTGGAEVDEFYQTLRDGIFAAGNALHVHDLADHVSLEAEALARGVAQYLREGALPACPVRVAAGEGVGHTVPQRVSGTRDVTLSLRVNRALAAPTVLARQGGETVARLKLPRALPAEMIRLPLKREKLNDRQEIEVCVE